MIGEWIRFGLAALCVLAGCFALLTAIVGLFRFDFSLNRLHAASIADTLGSFPAGAGGDAGGGPAPGAVEAAADGDPPVVHHHPLSGHMLAQFEYRVNQNLEQPPGAADGEQEDRA